MHHRLPIVLGIGFLLGTLLTGVLPAYASGPATEAAVVQAAGAPMARAVAPQAIVLPVPAPERLLREEPGGSGAVPRPLPAADQLFSDDRVVPTPWRAWPLYDLLRVYRC